MNGIPFDGDDPPPIINRGITSNGADDLVSIGSDSFFPQLAVRNSVSILSITLHARFFHMQKWMILHR